MRANPYFFMNNTPLFQYPANYPRLAFFFRFSAAIVGILVFFGGLEQACAQVRVNEILVVNTSGKKDEDATPQAWVELWNTSQTAKAVLLNQKLTDGTTTWTFPAADIMPDEHLIIWLSGKNRVVSSAPLHANFAPLPGGGSISLLSAAATPVLVSKLDYPAMAPNVSWGRDPSDAAVTAVLTGSYSSPTPENPNNFEGLGVSGKVAFSIGSQAFAEPLILTLSQTNPDPAAKIFYTTDRKIPTGAVRTTLELEYTVPISITTTQMIRARVFAPGKLPGETATQAYLFLNANAVSFSSVMPIVVISNFLTAPPPDEGDQASFMWLWEPSVPDNRSRFTNAPTFTSRTVIDKRGSSTLGNPKFNLNLETRNDYDDAQRGYGLLGMPAESDWVFHAPFSFDPSLIHNPLAFALSNAVGRYAPRNRMAEVFVDATGTSLNFSGTNNGDYFGVYNILEKVRRGKNRVNVKQMDKYDNDPVGKSGGIIWKVDRADTGDSGFTAGGQTFVYYTPKEIQMKSPQRDPQEQFIAGNTATNNGFLKQFNDALAKPTFTDPLLGYAPFLDVGATIDHLMNNVWTFNVDAQRLSAFWTKERGGKMYPGPVWDFDRALSSTDGRDTNPKVWYDGGGTDFFNYPWYVRLLRDPDFYQKYIDRWQDLRRPGKPFAREVVDALIDSLNAQISDEAVFRDLARWRNSKRSWTSPFPPVTVYPGTSFVATGATATTVEKAASGQRAEMKRLKDWLQQRADFFDSQWIGPVNTSLVEGRVEPGTQVTLTGPPNTVIYYTLNGADPRPPGGAVGPTPLFVPALAAGALEYRTPITISSTTRLRARAFKFNHAPASLAGRPPLVTKWGGLLNVRYSTDPIPTPGTLVVSEINYNPLPPTPAELAINPLWGDSDFEFLELHNPTASPLDLAGLQVADGVTFTIAGEDALSIPPGGHVLIADQPEAFRARYGAPLSPLLGGFSGDLSNGGEKLSLLAPGGAGLFSVDYDDVWHPATDGAGPTLVVYDPLANAASLAARANWRPSNLSGGSPGAYDPKSAPAPDAGISPAGSYNALALPGVLRGGLGGTASPSSLWSMLSGPGTASFSSPTVPGSTVAFTVPGTYNLRLTSQDGMITRSDDVTVYAQETPAYWLAQRPFLGALTDDYEGDGRSNFMEYALGTDPATLQASEPPLISFSDGRLSLTYTRLTSPGPVKYDAEITNDFETWRIPQAGELKEEILASDGFTQTVRITDTSVPAPALPRFMRLRMTVVP